MRCLWTSCQTQWNARCPDVLPCWQNVIHNPMLTTHKELHLRLSCQGMALDYLDCWAAWRARRRWTAKLTKIPFFLCRVPAGLFIMAPWHHGIPNKASLIQQPSPADNFEALAPNKCLPIWPVNRARVLAAEGLGLVTSPGKLNWPWLMCQMCSSRTPKGYHVWAQKGSSRTCG